MMRIQMFAMQKHSKIGRGIAPRPIQRPSHGVSSAAAPRTSRRTVPERSALPEATPAA